MLRPAPVTVTWYPNPKLMMAVRWMDLNHPASANPSHLWHTLPFLSTSLQQMSVRNAPSSLLHHHLSSRPSVSANECTLICMADERSSFGAAWTEGRVLSLLQQQILAASEERERESKAETYREINDEGDGERKEKESWKQICRRSTSLLQTGFYMPPIIYICYASVVFPYTSYMYFYACVDLSHCEQAHVYVCVCAWVCHSPTHRLWK